MTIDSRGSEHESSWSQSRRARAALLDELSVMSQAQKFNSETADTLVLGRALTDHIEPAVQGDPCRDSSPIV